MGDECRITIGVATREDSRPLLDHLAELGIGDVACILGTGANGEAAWPLIPLEAWLVGLNGAVEIPLPWPLKLDARMVFDTSTPRLPWYAAYCQPASCLTILGMSLPSECADYRFQTSNSNAQGELLEGELLSDSTVGGAALDMLRHCYIETGKPSTVYLCGLDFGGGYYFKRGEDGNRMRCQTPGKWGQLPAMQTLIADCQRRGMTILTLSETELDVPYAET